MNPIFLILLFFLIAIGFVLTIVAIVFASQKKTNTDTTVVEEVPLLPELPKPSFRSKEYLLTIAELKFYKSLITYLPSDLLIMCKVRVEDAIEAIEDIYSNRGRIKSRHVDFLLVKKGNLKILGCIELNDSSHYRSKVIARDNFIRKSFEEAGLKFVSVKTRSFYNKELIEKIFAVFTDS